MLPVQSRRMERSEIRGWHSGTPDYAALHSDDASPTRRAAPASPLREMSRNRLYSLGIPAANQLPPPLTISRTGFAQGLGGIGARTPSMRKSPLGSSGTRTES